MRALQLSVVLSTMGLLLTGCATTRAAVEKTAAQVLISDQQEDQLGLQVKEELNKQGIRYMDDAEVNAYVQNLATPLLQTANSVRKGVDWKLSVIDDPKTVNAFATPGGYVYVYSGLILAAENEAEVAGVLAHEAGHVVGRHAARQMVNAYGLETVLGLALGKNPGLISQIGASIVGNGAMLAHSRADETEADEYGATFTSKVGYDPRGIATFFEKLQQQQGKTPAILTWLSTHPATADRITHVNAFIARNGLTGSKVTSPAFTAIKAKLAARPAPPAAVKK